MQLTFLQKIKKVNCNNLKTMVWFVVRQWGESRGGRCIGEISRPGGRAAAEPVVDLMGVGKVSPGRAGDEARTRSGGEGQASAAVEQVLVAGSHRKVGVSRLGWGRQARHTRAPHCTGVPGGLHGV